jgi:hypothetical protein
MSVLYVLSQDWRILCSLNLTNDAIIFFRRRNLTPGYSSRGRAFIRFVMRLHQALSNVTIPREQLKYRNRNSSLSRIKDTIHTITSEIRHSYIVANSLTMSN